MCLINMYLMRNDIKKSNERKCDRKNKKVRLQASRPRKTVSIEQYIAFLHTFYQCDCVIIMEQFLKISVWILEDQFQTKKSPLLIRDNLYLPSLAAKFMISHLLMMITEKNYIYIYRLT